MIIINYTNLKKDDLIKLLNEKDELIKKLENKTDLRKELLMYARFQKKEIQEKKVFDLKEKIKQLILAEEKKLSGRKICEILNINRTTFFNNKLNKFLEKVYYSNFINNKFNYTSITISKNLRKKTNKYCILISQSALSLAPSDVHYFNQQMRECTELL